MDRQFRKALGESCLTWLPWHPSLITTIFSQVTEESCAGQVSGKLISFLEVWKRSPSAGAAY
jgi:hypothetical protein